MTKFRILRQFDCKRRRIQVGLLLLILICSSIIVFIYGKSLRTISCHGIRSTSKLVVELQTEKITRTEEMPPFHASSCQPINHIYFLRTHKTGSSTVGTILLSYGINRNHKIILDPDLADMHWPAPLELNEFSRLVDGDAAKIFVSHIRFNKGPANSVFPKPDAKYITILRNPVNQFGSAWKYYSIRKFAGVRMGAINTFLKSPDALEELKKRLNKTAVYERFLHFSNPNLYDMGLEQEYIQNMKLVKSYINKMEQEFDLVMITDYFDESLILLKRLLCWEFEDIVYIKLRAKKKKLEFEEKVENNILTWNLGDAILFDHFNKTFWKKVHEAGSTFYEDLETFRGINQEYQTSCESSEDQKMPFNPKKCALSKLYPCKILEKLWNKRGHKYTGQGCGPRAGEVAKWRRRLNSTSQ